MTLYELMGLVSTVALLLPILLLLGFKLALFRSFPALLVYCFILILCNLLLLNYIFPSEQVREVQDAIHNTLEPLLCLIFLTYFSRTVEFRRKLLWVAGALLVFEVVVLSIYGFNEKAYSILMAPGLALCIFFGLYFFVYQVKLSIVYQKAIGKALLISAMLFATIGFTYIYIVRYFTNPEYRQDADLIQFMISLFVAFGLSLGIFFERKRVQQLEELRIAREELKEIYGDDNEKATGPFGPVVFNADNEGWN